MTEVLFYSPHSSARLQYTLYWIFRNRLGIEFSITNSIAVFESYTDVKINYSNLDFVNCLNIYSNSILFDTKINEHFGEIGEWKGLKTIFKTENKEVPFDIFAAVFYCLSRMEEYDINEEDNHGRYLHTNSVLHKLNMLQTPIVDLWLEEFKNELKFNFPSLEFKKEEFKFVNTFDIDQAFSYLAKGLQRNVGGLLRDLVSFNFVGATRRILVMSGIQTDPYDMFDYILEKHKQLKLDSVVFLLLADLGEFDKNIDYRNSEFRKRIKLLQEAMDIGIHPSYYSIENPELLSKEINRLVEIKFQPVTQSRQHYLRFRFPDTPRNLLDAGIRHDYSLGYAETIGFRAGTSHPFQWFDIEKNEVTLLEIYPCCVMDVTLKNYMKLKPPAAIDILNELMQKVKEVNGCFIPIWHNESLSNYGEWSGWRLVYERMLPSKTV